MAARCAGNFNRCQPEWSDRRFRPSRAKAPDCRVDGQRRPALRRRLLVSLLPRDGAFRRRTAGGGPPSNRAIRGAEPEKRARGAWLCPCLLRKRRGRDGTGLFVSLARRVPARWIFLRAFELASFAGRNRTWQLGGGATALSRRYRTRRSQRRAATKDIGWLRVFVAVRTSRPSARRRRLACPV